MPPGIRKNTRHHGTYFHHYSVNRSASHLHNRVPARIPPIASKDSLDETSSPSVAQRLRTGSCPFGFTPCPNQAQTSNKAHDKFVPRRDCACADHSRPSLSTALLGGWSPHLALIRFRLTTPLSQAPLLGQDELTRRKRDLDTRGLSVRLHTLPNRVPPRIPPIASKDSLDETSSPSVAQCLRTGS